MSNLLKKVLKDNYGDYRVGWVIVALLFGLIAGVVLFLFIFGIPVRMVDHYYSSKYCQSHLRQINRKGKFVDYNFWDYQCLAKTGDKYVPLDQIYNNLQVEVSK